MANIKSSKKRILVQAKAAQRNKSARTLIKTNLKKFDEALSENDRDKAESAHRTAVKTIDRAATKGLIHKNKAAHKKSQITKQLNNI